MQLNKGGRMKNTKTITVCLILMLVFLGLTMIAVIYFAPKKQEGGQTFGEIITELQTKSPEKLYEYYDYKDNGAGMMTISYQTITSMREKHLQWEEDYPERAEKTIAITIDGRSRIFVLMYQTE